MPARHAGDQQRRLEPVPEKAHGEVDLVEVDLGERLVLELDVVPRACGRAVDVGPGRQPQMLPLARLDRARIPAAWHLEYGRRH
jgi:hypothetical protein